MDTQLQELIDRIQQEGVKEAEQKSQEIVLEAETKAAETIAEARTQAQNILEKAQREVSQLETTGKAAIKQAARDTILSLRSRITALFDAVIKREVKGVLQTDALPELLSKILHPNF